jgi:SRSO17 transposase
MQQVQTQQPRRAGTAVMSISQGAEADRLDEYFNSFHDDFRRRDQLRWACVYVQGLLSAAERRNVGTLARYVVLPPDLVVEDIAQALQNFVNQSPWDEAPVWRRFRGLFREELDDKDGLFVIEELAFCKQGRHSVGVQRQHSSLLGRKTNCQLAVALWHLSGQGLFPLGIRLYLPRSWVQSPQRLDAAAVPPQFRELRNKTQIALELLDDARAEGWTSRVVFGGAGPARDRALRAGLTERGLGYLVEWSPDLLAADGETVVTLDETTRIATNDAELARIEWAAVRARITAFRRVLMEELGLDHFEGRSWRGFHHHACLVALAFGFRLRERPI